MRSVISSFGIWKREWIEAMTKSNFSSVFSS